MTDIYQSALDAFGAEPQIKMLFEEMAELQMAICKNGRGKDNRDNIAEEIADVQIMLEQMKRLYGCAALASQYTEQKLDRLRERIGGLKMNRENILDMAKKCICNDREAEYGSPQDGLR